MWFQGSLLDCGSGPPRPETAIVERRQLTQGAWVDHGPGWLAGADDLFLRLRDAVPWRAERREMYDRTVDVPRLVCSFGVGEELPDPALVAAMDRVRAIASSGLALRKAQGLRVRLPLASLTVVTPAADALAPFADIVRDELNVKAVELVEFDDSLTAAYGITRRLAVNARAAGPRIGKQVQQAIGAAKAGDWSVAGEGVVVGGIALEPGEFTLELELADPAAAVVFLPGQGFVLLDTTVTPELEAEGLARDVIRAVQQARKDAGLDVSDRIALTLGSHDAPARAAIEAHRELIGAETLAISLNVREAGGGEAVAVGAGASVTIEVERA